MPSPGTMVTDQAARSQWFTKSMVHEVNGSRSQWFSDHVLMVEWRIVNPDREVITGARIRFRKT